MPKTLKASRGRLNLVPLSEKQTMLLTWWRDESPYKDYDGIITDGPVRIGKTMVGFTGYALWASICYDRQQFGVAGKSIEALKRNLWMPVRRWLDDVGISVTKMYDIMNAYVLKYSFIENGELIEHENYFYLFGGKDEASEANVQGFDAVGFFFDEVARMPESFVNQATVRFTIDSTKAWFNCNPDRPDHWFKKKWIDKAEEKKYFRLRLSMADNPFLSEKALNRFDNMYEGVFRQRYILGEWAAAEGSIYQSIIDDTDQYLLDASDLKQYLKNKQMGITQLLVGIDFGHNKSANTAVAVGIVGNYNEIIVLDEWYTTQPLDPEQLYIKHLAFIKKQVTEYGPAKVFCDNAEMMLVRGLYNSGLKIGLKAQIKGCVKHEIIDRIVFENSLFAQVRIKILNHCEKLIDAFKSATWDEKQKKDIRLDDGTSNIDSLDAFEYALCTSMKQLELKGRFN